MNIKTLIILIVLIGLSTGGFFVYKNLSLPEIEKTETGEEVETPPATEEEVEEGTSGGVKEESKAEEEPEDEPELTQVKTVNSAAAELTKISTQNCYAYAPSGWTNIENMQSVGFGYDAYNSDQSLMASYGMVGVPGEIVYFYGYTSPESFIEAMFFTLGYTNFSWQGSSFDAGEGYKTRSFQANEPQGRAVTGLYLYKTWNLPDGGFIVALRSAITRSDKWEENSALTFNVALSMRCTAQLQQRSGTSSVSSNDEISDIITSSYEKRQASLDKASSEWSEAMLGHENVYSPSTGDRYWAPLDSKWETGPEGSGYYRLVNQTTGEVEKLERGFGY